MDALVVRHADKGTHALGAGGVLGAAAIPAAQRWTLQWYPIGYTFTVRVRMTTVYRDWINGLRDDKSTQRPDVYRAIELARNLP